MRAALITFLFLASVTLTAQVSHRGIPYIRNFAPETYRGSEQNWAIVQDSTGVMYFGNNDFGILVYDGVRWEQITLPENPIVRSLHIHRDVIYAGGVNEFGYLATDPDGKKNYRSLSSQIPENDRPFADVWKIYSIGNRVYFSCELDRLFVFENLKHVKTLVVPQAPLFTFPVNGKVVAGTHLEGLISLENDTFLTLPGGEFFAFKPVVSIIPWERPWWQVGTYADGVFLYHPETGEISHRFPSPEANRFLKEHSLYHAISLPGNHTAYATLEGGALIVDGQGEIVRVINQKSGLRNEVVACLYHNGRPHPAHPLWLALSNGLAAAGIGLPVHVYDKTAGLASSILDIRKLGNVLYLGTLTGLYYLDLNENEKPVFTQVEMIPHTCWSLVPFTDPRTGEEILLAATQQGIYEIKGPGHIRSLEEESLFGEHDRKYYQCFSMHRSIAHPGKFYVGLKTGLISLTRENGRWMNDPAFKSFPAMEIRSICEDREGTLWAGTLGNGVIRLSFTGTDTLITTYGTQHGLPSLKNNRICRLEKGVVFATAKGIYRFDDQTETFLPDSSFPARYRDGSLGIHRMVPHADGSYWLACSRGNRHWIEYLRQMPDGSFHADTLPFKTLPGRETDAIFPDKDGITWFGISNELYSYSRDHTPFSHPRFYTLIRQVKAGNDSVLFSGYKPPGSSLPPASLPWNLNRVGFEFAAPFFIMEEKTRYSYLLEGLQEEWSPWSPEPRVTFNNLREGKYVFRVRAMNVYGQISPADTWQFVVSPPWYRSTLAWVTYILLAFLGVFSIVRWNARRLEKEKQQLETLVTERTREVIRQKEETEKQRDLARRQKKRIENQNRDIRDSIKYARRIQRAILPPEDFLSDFIPECFVMNLPKDIVSGDFYWFTEKNGGLIIAVADCTGHGVPGAFMSMLGMAYLNEIVNKSHISQPAEILYYLRIYVINSLHQSGGVGESRDGMDISLFTIHTGSLELEFAGAYHSLLIIREGKMHVLKGDRMPIGIHEQMNAHFTNHLFNLQKNDRLYAFTDGYADQFGGPSDKKITSGLMKKWLLEIHRKDMKTQREILENRFLEWKGKNQQVDDILMMGLKI